MTDDPLEAPRCADLARRGASGDGAARQELVALLWPAWLALLRHHRSLGPLASSDDHVHEVATRLFGKIADPDGRALQQYVHWAASHLDKTFADWMRIVIANLVRDYVREQLGARPDDPDSLPSAKRLLNEISLSPRADDAGIRPPFTAQQTIRQLLEFAASRLGAPQLRALDRWLQGASFDDIDTELELAPGDAQRLVRAGVAVLRRHFGGSTQKIGPPA